MNVELPPGVTIAPAPPELRMGNDREGDSYPFPWRHNYDDDDGDYRRSGSTALESAIQFPARG
jgi:hypothetical protein